MNDLTILMLTANRVPKKWAELHRRKLEEAVEGAPIITISFKPIDWGYINLLQTEWSTENVYNQMLRGAEIATTPFIAMADDDTLYPPEHFKFRPGPNNFAYNLNRWHALTWCYPFYYYYPVPGNGLMIAPRELVITALRNRFAMGLTKIRELGTLLRRAGHADRGTWLKFHTAEPVLSFQHEGSIDRRTRTQTKTPKPDAIQAYTLPRWGDAEGFRELWEL